MISAERHALLTAVLGQAQELGLLGPGPIVRQIDHAVGFAETVCHLSGVGGRAGMVPGQVLDLGSGGGVPGLVLAEEWPSTSLTLMDANERRAAFLQRSVERLGRESTVRVVTGRAEAIGRDEEERGRYDVVVARSFGPPAVTAECAASFLRIGGYLVISEPPASSAHDTEARWPEAGLAVLGMSPSLRFRREFGYQAVRQVTLCPARFPRRVGVPAKRPLF